MFLCLQQRITMCELNVKNTIWSVFESILLLIKMIVNYDFKYENRINKVIFLLQI